MLETVLQTVVISATATELCQKIESEAVRQINTTSRQMGPFGGINLSTCPWHQVADGKRGWLYGYSSYLPHNDSLMVVTELLKMVSREGRCGTPSVAPPMPLPSIHQLPGASLTMDCKGSHGIAEHLALKLSYVCPNILKEQASIPAQQYQSTSLPTVHNQPTSARPEQDNAGARQMGEQSS